MPGALRSHRGKTVYIPVIVPETWQLSLGFILAAIAGICIIISATTTNWRHQKMEIWDKSIATTPFQNLSLAVDFGLRSMHLEVCIHSNNLKNVKEWRNCNYEDVLYKTCAVKNAWCARADNSGSYAMLALVVCGIGAFLAICSQCLRRYMHFAWVMAVLAFTPFMLVSADQMPSKVHYSPQLHSFYQMAYVQEWRGSSLRLGVAGELILAVALLFMIWDMCRGVREIQKANAADAAAEGQPSNLDQRHPTHADV